MRKPKIKNYYTTVKLGERFICKGSRDVYILAQIEANTFKLISLENGNRYSDAKIIKEKDEWSIDEIELTQQEFINLGLENMGRFKDEI